MASKLQITLVMGCLFVLMATLTNGCVRRKGPPCPTILCSRGHLKRADCKSGEHRYDQFGPLIHNCTGIWGTNRGYVLRPTDSKDNNNGDSNYQWTS